MKNILILILFSALVWDYFDDASRPQLLNFKLSDHGFLSGQSSPQEIQSYRDGILKYLSKKDSLSIKSVRVADLHGNYFVDAYDENGHHVFKGVYSPADNMMLQIPFDDPLPFPKK